MVLDLKTAFSQTQAQEILEEGFQTSDMTSDTFGISELDAKVILGKNCAEILRSAASHFEYDEGPGVFHVDLASIQRIAEVTPVSTEALYRPPPPKL